MRYSEKRTCFLAIALLAVSAAFAVSAFGQGGATGTITGIVTDASGAVVPSASVLLQNTGTNVKWQTKSDRSGVYLFSNLPVGAYALKVTAAGFAAAMVFNRAGKLLLTVGQNGLYSADRFTVRRKWEGHFILEGGFRCAGMLRALLFAPAFSSLPVHLL